MRINRRGMQEGFTLIEVLLVTVVISMLLYLGLNYMQQKTQAERIDRTALQMQQILNAALAYYVDKGMWPEGNQPSVPLTTSENLQVYGYLPPNVTITPPWGTSQNVYMIGSVTPVPTALNGKAFFVYTYLGSNPNSMAMAQMIAGKLPLAMACANYNQTNGGCIALCTSGNPCYVVASVSVPGQNLNNALAVNYAGLYHTGACIPAPVCPLADMTPSIMVIPVSVTGAYDQPTGSPCNDITQSGCNVSAYPISSFTGYATPLFAATAAGTIAEAYSCGAPTVSQNCYSTTGATLPSGGGQYWRVCLSVATSKGVVNPISPGSGSPVTGSSPATGVNSAQGQIMGTVMVLTRCIPQNEGTYNSGFNVYQ